MAINLNNVKEQLAELGQKAIDIAQTGLDTAQNKAAETLEEIQRKKYMPLFKKDIIDYEYTRKMIVIVEKDPVRLEKYPDSIGYRIDNGGKTIGLYESTAKECSLTFTPNLIDSDEVYYVDPFDRDKYINLDKFFKQTKIAKVAELRKIASDLGAKHVYIELREENKSFVSKGGKVNVKAKKLADAEAEAEKKEQQSSRLSIELDQDLDGTEVAIVPELKYYQYDDLIKDLIEERVTGHNKNKRLTVAIDYQTDIAMSEKAAAKADGTLKKLKLSGNASLKEQVESNARMFFKYVIEF